MAQTSDFLERVKRELSAEEVAGLKTYSAQTERGKVLFMPIIRKLGAQVQWVSRVYVRGAIGALPATRASLKAIGAPDDWFEKSKAFQDALQREYPALPGVSGERPALEAGESVRL